MRRKIIKADTVSTVRLNRINHLRHNPQSDILHMMKEYPMARDFRHRKVGIDGRARKTTAHIEAGKRANGTATRSIDPTAAEGITYPASLLVDAIGEGGGSMQQEMERNYERLISAVAALPEVQSVGKSGGAVLPEAGESDIDIFVFCDEVPGADARRAAVDSIGDCVTDLRLGSAAGKHWGMCDFVFFSQAEICLMYFSIAKMNAEIESVLSGARPEKEDNYFYPTGRCASFLSMHILCDKRGYIAAMQEKLSAYPTTLATRLVHHHMDMLSDIEDLERAVSRKDALFYHFALDLSLDHFLQALFALNGRYFPSRKRSLSFIETFPKKPARCGERLLEVVALGARGETVAQSYEEFMSLCHELSTIT